MALWCDLRRGVIKVAAQRFDNQGVRLTPNGDQRQDDFQKAVGFGTAVITYVLIFTAGSELAIIQDWDMLPHVETGNANFLIGVFIPLGLTALLWLLPRIPYNIAAPTFLIVCYIAPPLVTYINITSGAFDISGAVFYLFGAFIAAFLYRLRVVIALTVYTAAWIAFSASFLADPFESLSTAVSTIVILMIGSGSLAYMRTAQQLVEAKLARAAHLDTTTGLETRWSLTELEQELAQAANTDLPVSFIIFDVDGFAEISKLHGHAVGEAALRMVADEIRTIAPPQGRAFRLGGDELALVLPGSEIGEAQRRADEVLHNASELPVPRSQNLAPGVAVSCGIACHWGTADLNALYEEADHNLYALKRQASDECAEAEATCASKGQGNLVTPPSQSETDAPSNPEAPDPGTNGHEVSEV